MSTNPRTRRHLRRKITAYIVLVAALGLTIFLLNFFVALRNPIFVSPIGKINTNGALVEKLLKDNKIRFSTIIRQSNYYSVNIQNNGQVKISQDKNIVEQITSLQRILRELTIEGKPFKSIDFRFSEPIISF
jgi:hypothetical protein